MQLQLKLKLKASFYQLLAFDHFYEKYFCLYSTKNVDLTTRWQCVSETILDCYEADLRRGNSTLLQYHVIYHYSTAQPSIGPPLKKLKLVIVYTIQYGGRFKSIQRCDFTWLNHKILVYGFTLNNPKYRAGPQMPTTKNIERQMVSVGDQISQKNSTSGFTWPKILRRVPVS